MTIEHFFWFMGAMIVVIIGVAWMFDRNDWM